MKQRIRYFDIAKGIGILCVVLGHAAIETMVLFNSNIAKEMVAICFSFHMPLFFLLAGYFIHPERKFQWLKESKQLVFTYILAAVLVVGGATALAALRHTGIREVFEFWLYAATYGSGDVSGNTLWVVQGRIGAIWFLLAMFWARLLIHAFARLPYTGMWVVLAFVVGWESSKFVTLPWSIQPGLCATVFLYIGYQAKQHDVLGALKRSPWLWIVAALFWIAAIHWFTGFSMAMNNYGMYPVLAAVGAIAGTVCVVGISQAIDHASWLKSWLGTWLTKAGQASLAILCVHLVEDDVLPWTQIFTAINARIAGFPFVIIAFALHLAIDLPGAWLLYHIPGINGWFYPMRAKGRATMPHKNTPAHELHEEPMSDGRPAQELPTVIGGDQQ
ncbi:acyltransferase family protein [Bifidobacterium gallicum]|uniref:Acyltransferase n=1 Tax=Bifidobacterium gallicum DSM 20093 = LMG 11596 TaxID=561180 RepID=D1NVS2_9BIFI|nr:acyltransferase family protein [Bifidobacterium gallicum]EFA22923.1 acyltransferase [Bifidobacterium gallicum DSM 20093 = LMG 11596]KFI59380.1 acyltransferase [Bifidobacterium gallicum DSM 20093 = LMG 11596]